ncbi:MetQ/NlpA family ABC transporter substrate-binding protein [Bifidobacterium sp. ESL0784]|uniref:MetQ/NlpA family ABC transporter substrate-binding protein n=1 Tax=Bifidobacterium sp. ESL0784 TaxID=2983231 RepID=UPI0023F6ECF6|nr:MetQ/NlpA family ABC transporter substrate-binding protein [Bifidobacterium sp. ESL0784]MDF7641100.1 MetQ/NlpA family ABC transporter substrate-binding protein [Bifidobacterium sp. ESL0784]
MTASNNHHNDGDTSGKAPLPVDGFQSSEEPVRVNHTARNVIIAAVVVVLVVVLAFFGYRGFVGKKTAATKGSESDPIKIGVVGVTSPEWPIFKAEAQKQGIYVKLVDFQDYTSENPALDSGDLDLNEFQHIRYLADYNVKNHKDLQPIGGVAVYPLGIYSSKYKDVKDIPAGTTVPVPNDETNQARALGVLKSAGLIKLKHAWTAFTAPSDIDTAASKVKVLPLKAEQVANSLKDPQVSAGVINNDYVKDAGLKASDAIYHDSAETKEARPYINIFVARKADANNPTYLKLVKIFHSKKVSAGIMKKSDNSASLADEYSAEQLQGFLQDVEKDAKTQQ